MFVGGFEPENGQDFAILKYYVLFPKQISTTIQRFYEKGMAQ